MLDSLLVIVLLIAISSFFSLSEISLAAARKIKLKLLADEGNINAQRVMPERRRHSGRYRRRCRVLPRFPLAV